jgi:hypothetical protein
MEIARIQSMARRELADRGVRKVESGFDPGIVPVEDLQSGDEGIDDVDSDSNKLQDEKEPLDPPSPAEND